MAHRDLKPPNILVSNKHYANITDTAECKLTNFGESRSLIYQTRTVSATRTKNMQRGTPLFMAPERLPEKCYINPLSASVALI